MAIAKKCDRCGAFFEGNTFAEEDFKSGWWRYSLMRDNHPYSEERLDLCNECKKALYEWYRKGKADENSQL